MSSGIGKLHKLGYVVEVGLLIHRLMWADISCTTTKKGLTCVIFHCLFLSFIILKASLIVLLAFDGEHMGMVDGSRGM